MAVDDQTRNTALGLIFGGEAVDIMATATKEGSSGLRDMYNQLIPAGQAATQSAARLDSFKGSVEQMRGALETAAILVGNVFLPVLRLVVDGVSAAVTAFTTLPQPVIALTAILLTSAAAFGAIRLATQYLGPAFGAVTNGMRGDGCRVR